MFNKREFSKILKKIYKKYNNQREFADAMGVSRSYLSRAINEKLDNPPTPKILSKIAKASNDITTYEELMNICGYYFFNINKKNSEDEYKLFLEHIKNMSYNLDISKTIHYMSKLNEDEVSQVYDYIEFILSKKKK